MSVPPYSARLAEARARFERTTHPDWRDSTDMGVALAEVDALCTQLGDWVAAVGQAKDDAVRALGLLGRGDAGQLGSLLQRMAGGEHELPQRESLQAENERLRAELADAREIASLASVLEIPRENAAPLQLRQIYDDVDRWAICDRTGRRWYRAEDGVAAAGWFYEPDREALCDLGRFTLAEALPLARELATFPTS